MTLLHRYRRILLRFAPGAVLSLALSACAGIHSPDAGPAEQAIQDPAAMMRIASAAEQSGDPAGAAAFYHRAAELQPDSEAAQIGVARTLVEQGRLDEAIDSLRSAHARSPSDTDVSLTLGRLLVAAGRAAEALDTLRDGLRHAPRSAPLLVAQGVALDTMGRHTEAQSSYKEALTISPDSAAANKDLSLSLAQSRRDPQSSPNKIR